MAGQSDGVVSRNRTELGPLYDSLTWLSGEDAALAEQARADEIAAFPETVQWSFDGTKPHYGTLSPGCLNCAAGTWSCLFVNGRCNATCFFCPTSQDDIGEAGTSTLTFRGARDYVDYVAKGGFQGVGFSGGEPLLTLERTLEFAAAVRQRLGETIYVWMYTNGLLMTREKARLLRDAGIDEVRFNLHASGYSLTGLEAAVGTIPTVTVEIPAVPEEEDRLVALLPLLSDLGVRHLHLHQLRCTPHNVSRMVGRPYHAVQGPKVTILESELLALKLIGAAARSKLNMGVQYCAFAYKNPHQTMGARRRWGQVVKAPWEDLTATGAIRTVHLSGSIDDLRRIADELVGFGVLADCLKLDTRRQRLYLPCDSLAMVQADGVDVVVGYEAAVLVSRPTYHFAPIRFDINDRMSATIERRLVMPPTSLQADDLDAFMTLAVGEGEGPVPASLRGFAPFERRPRGLAPYA